MTEDRYSPYPFPAKPITKAVIDEEIECGGWTANVCPLCEEHGASWRLENKDVSRYLCPRCQRFILSGPRRAGIKHHPDERAALSDAARTSDAVAEFV